MLGLAALVQLGPDLFGDDRRMTSEEMYHRLFEANRQRRAAALAGRGNCLAALAYAERTASPAVIAATRRRCPAGVSGAPVLAAPPGPPTADEEVAAFTADPRHPLFALVRADMARLMGEGRALDLPSAYDQAVSARAAQFRAELSGGAPRP